jgi:protoheme IX farnesyltransferase
MLTNKTYSGAYPFSLKNKLKDYQQLIKLRLNTTVVLSTFFGFLLGSPGHIYWAHLLIVVLGGFLTVGAANGINQIIEKNSDKLMRRTENRPLATNRMSVEEAVIACLVMGVAGVLLITLYLNMLAGVLSLVSLILYGFVYTPLKKITPISVYVGAIPGALPTIIGYVAASGTIGALGWILFIIQFIWQFPHFYSIAWICDEDYKRAGLKMMPIGTVKDRKAAIQIVLFSLLLLPVSVLPYIYGYSHIATTVLLFICSGMFTMQSIKLYRSLDNKDAKKLMFYSIIYLPLMFLILLIDKMIS